MKITKEEILKLGQISMIDISENDIPNLVERFNSLLNYVSCLKNISEQHVSQNDINQIPHNVNVLRNDSVNQINSDPIINLAPKSESNYFVVPAILKDSKQ